jgi:SAM-dependent methyltransferase
MTTVGGGAHRGGAHRIGAHGSRAHGSEAPASARERDSQEGVSSGVFAATLREWAHAGPGRPVCVLQAGCLAPVRELGLRELAESGHEVSVSMVDGDQPPVQAVLKQVRDAYDDVMVGDLRTIPLQPRGFDVVYCGHLLERIRHVEVVLDRLVGALRPGGLLLIRVGDRDSAWALLDRRLPYPLRHAIWQRLHPGVPGPFPAVYERLASERGMASYALLRGLVIAQRAAERTLPDSPRRLSSSVRVTCAVIARLSRGRYDDSHDELLYVIRKPEDRFARVV